MVQLGLTDEQIEQVKQIVRTMTREAGLRYDIATVAAVPSAGKATLNLDGSTAQTSEPVPCLTHYTPAVSDRVLVLWAGKIPIAVLGKF